MERLASFFRGAQAGKFHLEKEEDQAVQDFNAAKDAYAKSRADLVDAGNTLNVRSGGLENPSPRQ